jgi:hypothetical protein
MHTYAMIDLPKVPLHQNSTLEVYDPKIDFFVDKIVNKEYFSMVRFQTEFWMLILWSLDAALGYHEPDMRSARFVVKEINLNEKDLDTLGKQMVKEWYRYVQSSGDFKFTPFVFTDLVRMVVTPKPKDFYLAVNDNPWHRDYGVSKELKWSQWMSKLIKLLIPKGETPFNAITLRRAVEKRQMHKLINVIKDMPVCIVAPKNYTKFAETHKLSNYIHIPIDSKAACFHVKDTLNTIREAHKKLSPNGEDVFFLFAGGAPGAWMIINLHEELKNVFMIEFGRSLTNAF